MIRVMSGIQIFKTPSAHVSDSTVMRYAVAGESGGEKNEKRDSQNATKAVSLKTIGAQIYLQSLTFLFIGCDETPL